MKCTPGSSAGLYIWSLYHRMCYSSTYILFEDTHTTATMAVILAHKNSWSVSSDLRGRLGFRWMMSWTAWWCRHRLRCPEQPESRRHWRRPWGPPVWRWTARCSRSRPRPSGGCAGACRTQRRMGHVGLLPEVELAVAKLLLVIDERRQRERLVLVMFIRGLQVRNMDSSFALVYENDL
jgi:hypothetical protein